MSYKTILVHVDHSPHCEARVRAAAAIALQHQAHLIGAAMSGVSRFMYEDGGVDPSRTVVALQMAALNQRAHSALERFELLAGNIGVASVEPRMVNDEPEGGLLRQARYADLVVVSQHDPEDACSRLAPGLPAYVMLSSARPVLVVPHASQSARPDGKLMLAWDASMEATRAVASALPLLKRAAAVCVAVFNAGRADDADSGKEIAVYLARHGIAVELVQRAGTANVGEALLSLAADQQVDLLVMGGYGHARMREVLLGGVTETILRSMTVPVLMAH